MTPIYLDYAAATPLDDRVRVAMEPYLTTDFTTRRRHILELDMLKKPWKTPVPR